MTHWQDQLAPWLDMLLWGSAFGFIATLVIIPLIIIRLPTDYFAHRHRTPASPRHPLLRLALMGMKNLLGLALLLLGVILLVLPGQGILTILLGLGLMNFPGKYQLEQGLIGRPTVARSLNWLRRRYGKAPFDLPEESHGNQSPGN